MTTLELKLNLPDDLAKRAQSAGLLTPEAIEAMLRERNYSGRQSVPSAAGCYSTSSAPLVN